jgi:NTP pyrophosphatase (non-canonical NTP hydrolase)
MEADQYQSLAWETAKPFYKCLSGDDTFHRLQLVNAVLALNGESGELANKLKKFIENGDLLNSKEREILIEELGDVAWYVSHVASLLNIKLSDVLGQNVSKLRERYKNTLPHRT